MWNDLTMRERADLIRQGVALGYKDIDSIRNNYHSFGGGSTLNSSYQDPNPYYNRLDDKHKKEWRSLSAQRQKFNQMLQQYSPQIYNDPQLRNTMEFIAFNEGRWVRPINVPKSGATGYFQLTPPTIRTYNQAHNTNYSTKDPAQDFAMMQYTVQTSMDNINKLLKDPTFRRKAQELGWDQYDLLKASWLLGPTGMKNHVLDPKRYNPKDEYGSSASSYVKNKNSTGDNVMVVNRGVEQPPAILITPEDVRRQLEEEQNPPVQTNQNEVQPTEPVSDTLLQDQYERLVQENAELSQADQEMKEKWNQMMENVQTEQERQNIVSMINTLGWQKAQPITPIQGQITNDERVYNNPVLAAQMYNRRNNRISNGSFGKYFFNGQEDNTPMILGYNPYSPVMAFGGAVHRYDYAGTVNTPYSNNKDTGLSIVQNQ